MKFVPLAEIEEIAKKIAEETGVEFVEAEVKTSPSPSLTVYIDTEDGVDLVTCEKFHRAIDPALDEKDVSYGSPYTLNVSSPGLDRPLKTQRDFERAIGEDVEVKLFAPMRGKKYLEGVLADFDENTVTLEISGQPLKIEKNKIAKINKAIVFE